MCNSFSDSTVGVEEMLPEVEDVQKNPYSHEQLLDVLTTTSTVNIAGGPLRNMLFCPYCSNNLTIGVDAEDSGDKCWYVPYTVSPSIPDAK